MEDKVDAVAYRAMMKAYQNENDRHNTLLELNRAKDEIIGTLQLRIETLQKEIEVLTKKENK